MRDYHGGRPYESQACKDEKKAYRDENDKITEFMRECGLVADREGLGRIEIARIMQLWKEWDPEDKKMTTRRLSKNLREKYELVQSKAINGVRYLTGIYEKSSELDFAGQGEGA
jgi:hypothetical protein